jgi:hypothetical protein
MVRDRARTRTAIGGDLVLYAVGWLLVVLALAMLLSRLEFLTVLVLLDPALWRR